MVDYARKLAVWIDIEKRCNDENWPKREDGFFGELAMVGG